MNIARRTFMTVLGRIAGAVSATLCFVPRWLYGGEKVRMKSESDEPVAVDALIVGGGVQGLILLNELTRKGYSTVLVTNSDLGTGQTLHSHGILNSGYPYPRRELRESLKQDWLPFAGRSGLQIYGEDRFYVLTPPEPFEQLREGWNALGYEHEAVSRNSLPAEIQAGELFRDNTQTMIAKIREYTFPKRQLIRILSDGVRDRIIRGSITAFHCVSKRTNGLKQGNANTVAVESVEVQTEASGRKVELRPKRVIAAAGTGTKGLIDSIVAAPSFTAAVSEIGADSIQWRERILSQVRDVACRSTHMICIRAPRDDLPAINLFVIEYRLMLITANVNPTHDSLNDDTGGFVTWYVTPLDPDAVPAEHVPDTAQAEAEEDLTADGVRRLLKVFPALKEKAQIPGSRIEFTAYAGYKQDIGEEKNRPSCRKIEGIDNVIVTLPSLFTGAFVNAGRVLELLEGQVEPSGVQAPVAGTAEGVEIGQVTENTAGTKWMNWTEFLKAYPSIDA